MTLKARVGVFFISMSLIVLLVYFASVQAEQSNIKLFIVGFIGLVLGGIIVWRNRIPPPPVERFRGLRSSRVKRAEKKKQKKEKQG